MSARVQLSAPPPTISCRFPCCAAFWWFCWSPGLGIRYSHGCHQISDANRWIGPTQVQRPHPLCKGKCEKGGCKSAFQRTGFKLHSSFSCEHGGVCNVWSCTEIYRSLLKVKLAYAILFGGVLPLVWFFCKATCRKRCSTPSPSMDSVVDSMDVSAQSRTTDSFVLFL